MDANAVRDEKLKVLRSLKPITEANASQLTVRGQYRAGASTSGAVTGYQEELGSASNTETFVAIKAEVANWRWAGVPFYLRTGKRLAARMSEIVIAFKPVPHSIFGDSAGQMIRNKLVIRLQPDEGVKQWMMIKDPGPGGMRLKHVPLDMTFADAFNVRNPDAYERLLMDVVRGNQTLFMRRDEVEAAWQWVDPILKAWEETAQPAQGYTSGTWGPSSAIALIERMAAPGTRNPSNGRRGPIAAAGFYIAGSFGRIPGRCCGRQFDSRHFFARRGRVGGFWRFDTEAVFQSPFLAQN